MAKKKKNSGEEPKKTPRVVAENRKAKFDYHFVETFEAGLVLTGSEVKSIRKGNVSLQESYVRPFPDGLYLVGAHITPYETATNWGAYDPVRPRKLLLKKREEERLRVQVSTKGMTIAVRDIHFTRGFAKVLISLAKGKAAPDKRKSIQERDVKRELQRKMKYIER